MQSNVWDSPNHAVRGRALARDSRTRVVLLATLCMSTLAVWGCDAAEPPAPAAAGSTSAAADGEAAQGGDAAPSPALAAADSAVAATPQLQVTHYDNGQKQSEGTYTDGKAEGIVTRWYEDGQQESQTTYVSGVLEGPVVRWHPSGTKREEGTFKAGEKEGSWTTYFESGKTQCVTTHAPGGAESSRNCWNEDGTAVAEAGTKNDAKAEDSPASPRRSKSAKSSGSNKNTPDKWADVGLIERLSGGNVADADRNTPTFGGGPNPFAPTAPARTKSPRIRQAKAKVQGDLDKDIIRRIVRSGIAKVRSCYDEGLSRNPELAGRVAIAFTIEPTGAVSNARVDSDTTSDAQVSSCIAKAVGGLKFPKPRDGGKVTVVYPFNLSPG